MVEKEKKYFRTHEDLIIYQKAFDAAMQIFELSKRFPVEERYSLTDQIRRSSRSVCANLAEAWRSGGSPRRRKTQGNVHQEKRRYKAAFVAKFSDSEAALKDTALHKAAETQVWLKFAVKCQYLTVEEGRELYGTYNQILSGLVKMITHPEDWLLN
ncbi:MAG: four helix bundle protein [Xenococcus sp. (in: cyanobacteria)]